ncbi:MAG: hydroxyacid dehydrogenase [Phycisphaeraceae bacterium]
MKKKALFISSATAQVYSDADQKEIGSLVDIYLPPMTAEEALADPSCLSELQILLTTWGAPKLDESFLSSAPNLEAVFYAAGSVRSFVTEAFWERDLVVCSAWQANAVPVAEFTLSQIIFGLKQGYQTLRHYRIRRDMSYPRDGIQGAYGGKVGLVSLGAIARKVVDHLHRLDVQVFAYDPYVTPEQAKELGVTLVSLDEVFHTCDVVSLHTPWLKETERMIRGEHFEAMKPNTTFINTARGAVVNETEMIEVLRRREDLVAVLDVTWPEPPVKDSPLWDLPNVVLTPHIAGSVGRECYRMGRMMTDELRRYLEGRPLQTRLTRQRAQLMA